MRDAYGSYTAGTSTPLDDIVNNTDPYISGTNDWCEDYYYGSGKLRRVTFPEGHISLYNNSKGPVMQYVAKDHVGSIRVYREAGDTSFVRKLENAMEDNSELKRSIQSNARATQLTFDF